MPETELGLQILVGSIVKHYEQQLLCRKKKTQRAVNEQHKCGEVSRCCCRGLNGKHRIVEYHRQQRTHLCCIQNSIRYEGISGDLELKLTLDLDVL
ncbi:hypothetical protein F2P79_002414 [Pimephales promelas]|nr:hypothetical protein F2P79_002414 [Pimephales promelas]